MAQNTFTREKRDLSRGIETENTVRRNRLDYIRNRLVLIKDCSIEQSLIRTVKSRGG